MENREEILLAWDEYVSNGVGIPDSPSRLRFEALTTVEQRGTIVKEKFWVHGDIFACLEMARTFKHDGLKRIAPELLKLGTYFNGLAGYAQDLLLSLPKDWILQNIEHLAEDMLAQEHITYEEYHGVMTVYTKIDPELTYKLANRALEHDDPEIQEAGEWFWEWLRENGL